MSYTTNTNTRRHPLAAIGTGVATLAVIGAFSALGIAANAVAGDIGTQPSAVGFSSAPGAPVPPAPATGPLPATLVAKPEAVAPLRHCVLITPGVVKCKPGTAPGQPRYNPDQQPRSR